MSIEWPKEVRDRLADVSRGWMGGISLPDSFHVALADRMLAALGGEQAYLVWDKEYSQWWAAYASKAAAEIYASDHKHREARPVILIKPEGE